jgi:hypothetical protein
MMASDRAARNQRKIFVLGKRRRHGSARDEIDNADLIQGKHLQTTIESLVANLSGSPRNP